MTYTTDHTTAPTSDARRGHLASRYTEAKDGFKTSEFYVMAAFVAAVLFATYLDSDSLAGETGGASRPSPWSPTSSAAASPSWACDTPPTTSKTGFNNSETATAAPFPSKGNGAAAHQRLPAALSSQRHGTLITTLQRYVTWRETVSAHSRRRPSPGEVMRITRSRGRGQAWAGLVVISTGLPPRAGGHDADDIHWARRR